MKTDLKHLAIIMDGNGRWATRRGRDRFWGHLRGARIAQNVIEECSRTGIEVLTLFAFSTENWFRPKEEITFLMQLLKRQLRREREKLMENQIRFKTVGDIRRLPTFAREEVEKTIELTKNNTGMTLVFALSYGARTEITNACVKIAEQIQSGQIQAGDIDEDLLSSFLETRSLPDPDLIVRTSGEYRLSNFLLWQAAYSELHISDSLWPEFTIQELHEIIETFGSRERRFGRVKPNFAKNLPSNQPIRPDELI